jgi:hypothetical protein
MKVRSTPIIYNNEASYIVGIVCNTLEQGDRLAGLQTILITNVTKAKTCDTKNFYQIFPSYSHNLHFLLKPGMQLDLLCRKFHIINLAAKHAHLNIFL